MSEVATFDEWQTGFTSNVPVAHFYKLPAVNSSRASISSGFVFNATSRRREDAKELLLNAIKIDSSNTTLKRFIEDSPSSNSVDAIASSWSTLDFDAASKVNALQEVQLKLQKLKEFFFLDYGKELSGTSCYCFIELLASFKKPTLPSLSADPSGELIAVWKRGANSVSLKFLDSARFHYALALETSKGINRPWGTSSRHDFFAAFPSTKAFIEAES
jgi:hypothetical protein